MRARLIKVGRVPRTRDPMPAERVFRQALRLSPTKDQSQTDATSLSFWGVKSGGPRGPLGIRLRPTTGGGLFGEDAQKTERAVGDPTRLG